MFQVSNYMAMTDKLSLRTTYGPYKSQELTCRAPTTQDALDRVEVSVVTIVTMCGYHGNQMWLPWQPYGVEDGASRVNLNQRFPRKCGFDDFDGIHGNHSLP